ncbi:hypothetical protein JGU66_14095 [Myxococcaceae bacterium JPH2]|nr:hypothetical protein [Myxococcaceae bacterium JPH2]
MKVVSTPGAMVVSVFPSGWRVTAVTEDGLGTILGDGLGAVGAQFLIQFTLRARRVEH